jgi:hypothetical protein
MRECMLLWLYHLSVTVTVTVLVCVIPDGDEKILIRTRRETEGN